MPAGGKGTSGWPARIGAIASCQIGAAPRPPYAPTSWLCFGLSTMTLAVICGV
jgi:hypothetical protein